MKHGYIVNPIPYVLLYLIGVQESQLHSPDNLPQNIKSVGNPESTMKRRRRIPRLGRMRVARARCYPCLSLWSGILESSHFYTDLGCYCCNSRSARPDGRDLKKHLNWMPDERFRIRAREALAAETEARWSTAISCYEACLQALSEVRESLTARHHLWLLMWASTPLVSLYHLKSRNFAKSVEVSEMLVQSLVLRLKALRLSTWCRRWYPCCKNLRLHYRCRERLGRILKELLLAYDALERDRRLAYYEWGGEEMRSRALEGFEYGEHDLCQWLSKSHKQYGDYGRARHWASLRKKINVQGSDNEEHWKMRLYDAELMRGCGDADGCKQKIFSLREDLLRRTNGQDGGDLDFEALATVEEHRNVIKQNHQFYLDTPVKQGKVQASRSLRNKQRVKPDWMEVAQDDGLELHENEEYDAAISCYREALHKIKHLRGRLRYKGYEFRITFLEKLAQLFNDRYHLEDRAPEDLDTAIRYFRRSFLYTWLKGSRADECIWSLQRVLGWLYGIRALRNYNENMLLHELEWNPTLHDWDYWHSDKEILERVISQGHTRVWPRGSIPDVIEAPEKLEMRWVERTYMGSRITEFIKAWQKSMTHNRIAAAMVSYTLHSMRDSAAELDDTWAIHSLSEQNLVFDGLQGRLQEEMVLKQLLATCCKGASVKKKILKYLDRSSKFSGLTTPKSCGSEGHGQPVDMMMTPAQEALLWAERSRTNALAYQLLPSRLHSDALDKLHDFDLQDQVASDIIMEAIGVCGKGAVVVEFSYLKYDQIYIAYVIQQDGRVDMRSLPIQDEDELEEMVKELLSLLSEDSGEDGEDGEGEDGEGEDGEGEDGEGEDGESEDEFAASRRRVMDILKELYFMFMDTISDLLEKMTSEDRLIIVPCEVVAGLPFQLLLDEGGNYLFEKFILSITPSLRTLKYLSERFCTLQKYSLLDTGLLVGDPAYQNEADRLDASKGEVNLISAMFKEKGITKLLGADASVKNVLDCGRRPSEKTSDEHEFCEAFVHIAAHGIVNEKYKKGALQLAHPGAPGWASDLDLDSATSTNEEAMHSNQDSSCEHQSSIKGTMAMESEIDDSDAVATQPSAEIGGVIKRGLRAASEESTEMLSSEGIIGCGFEWRFHMVVLSACNSAKGKELSEGVLNLPRAFLIAGVPCIVASQWLVDDALTPKIMEAFYGNMKQGEDVASALCHSMRLVKRENERDLQKWGVFNVWGLPTVCLPKDLQASHSDPPDMIC